MSLTAAQITALTAELNADPKARGYASPLAAGTLGAVADLLNSTYAGVGQVFRNDIANAELLAAIVWSEVSGFTATQVSWAILMLSPPIIDGSNANVRAFFNGLFTGKATTLTNLTAVAQKANPTRAEELFGYGTVVTAVDVAHALGR